MYPDNTLWLVIRTDESGRSYLICDGRTESEAREREQEMTALGHKQTYTSHPYRPREKAALLQQLKIEDPLPQSPQ